MAYPGPQLANDQCFRVLQLHPGSTADPIRFSLHVASLSEPNPQIAYEALSYAWGDATLTHEILYEDVAAGKSGSLMVTVNCHNALKRLRLPDQSRAIWLDAVCINQLDLDERSTQIQMMRAIYIGASQVAVYLGESQDDSDSVMRYLQDLHEPVDYPRQDITILPPTEDAWKSFFARPWFSRTWVLQEIINGRSVEIHCGDLSVPWKAFEDYNDFQINSYRPYILSGAVVRFWETYRFRYRARRRNNDDDDEDYVVKPGVNLLYTLQKTRGCLSSDPRDKLYGILPLLQDHELEGFSKPDYYQSTEQVFTNLALYLYQQTGPEVIREGATMYNEGHIQSLPSWVPDWTRTKDTRLIRLRQWMPACAGGDIVETLMPQGIATADGQPIRQLRLSGIRIGSPVKMSDECDVSSNIFPLGQWQEMARDAGILLYEDMVPPTPEQLAKSMQRDKTEHADDFMLLITHANIVYLDAIRDGIQLVFDWEKEESSGVPLKDIFHSLGHSYGRQASRMLQCCDQRKLAILDNGLMALVPTYTEFTDVVYIIPGTTVPLLLRKKKDHHVLVSECYVQGIMHGEARERAEESSMEQLVLG
jgi:hypothetical protein